MSKQRLSRYLQNKILNTDLETKILSYKNVYLAHNTNIDKRGKIVQIAKESELLFRFMSNHYNIILWPNTIKFRDDVGVPTETARRWFDSLVESARSMRHAQRIVFYKKIQVKSNSSGPKIILDFQIDAVPIKNKSGNYITNMPPGMDWCHPFHGRALFNSLIDNTDKDYNLIKGYLPPKYFKCRIDGMCPWSAEALSFDNRRTTIIFDPSLMQYFFDKQNLDNFSKLDLKNYGYFIYLGTTNYPINERYFILTLEAVTQATNAYVIFEKIKFAGEEKLQTYLNQIILLQLSRMLHEILHLDHSSSPYHTIHKCNDDPLDDDHISWHFIDLETLDDEKYMLFSNISTSKEVIVSKSESFSVASKSIAVNILDATPTTLLHDKSVYRFEKTYHIIENCFHKFCVHPQEDGLKKLAKLIIDCVQKSIKEKPIAASNLLISLSSIEARYENLKKRLRLNKKLRLISDNI